MTEPTKDQIAAAVGTPIRDLRDEVWVRVYAAAFVVERARADLDYSASKAGAVADEAVAEMPIPEHRRAEAGLQ